jgi:uncharacterized membrane protein HdeD (DUF308 family)
MVTEENKKLGENKKVAVKEQRLFRRILGLFLILYGFLVLSQPLQYGLGLPTNLTPLLGIGFVLLGIYLVLRQ